MAATYTGAPSNTVSLYLDGALSNSMVTALNVNRAGSALINVGSWYDNNANAYTMGGKVGINTLRVHDGALTAAQVAYNFFVEAPRFIPSLTPTHTSSPTKSGTPSTSATSSATASPSTTASPSGTPPNTPSVRG